VFSCKGEYGEEVNELVVRQDEELEDELDRGGEE